MIDARYKDIPLSDEFTAREQLLLVRLIEDCAELTQAITKMLRFGPDNYHPAKPDESNTAAFRRERDDLLFTLAEMGESGKSLTQCR